MTITATPADYSSVHGDLIYTVYDAHSTDSATYPNYKYVADVYVNSTLVATLRKVQDPTTGVGVFNIGQVVRNYLATAFNPTPANIVAQTLGSNDFYVSVVVKFGEEYDFTTYVDLAIDSARRFYNHYNGRIAGALTPLSSKVDNLATNNSLRGEILLSSSFYLVPFLANISGLFQIKLVTVTPYGGGTPLSTAFTATQGVHLYVLNLSPVVLNSLQAGTITAATKYYTVQIGSQVYRIDLICEPRYETYTLHFLNQYGGFESKLFTKVSRTKYKVERKDFGKLNYTVDNTGAVNYWNSNGVYNESRSVYSAQIEERLTLNTDLLTNEDYVWLSDLIFSPMVFLQDGEYFLPVVIQEDDYEPKKTINDDLTNLTITVEFGQQLNAQYR